jgi:hypothetical protein
MIAGTAAGHGPQAGQRGTRPGMTVEKLRQADFDFDDTADGIGLSYQWC